MIKKLPCRINNSLFNFMVKSIFLLIIQSFLFTIIYANNSHAQNVLESKFTLHSGNITLGNLYEIIEKKTGLKFVYNVNEINESQFLSLDAENFNVKQIFQQIANKTQTIYWLRGDNVVVTSKKNPLQPQDAMLITVVEPLQSKEIILGNGGIVGIVTDKKTREPLIGASIQIKGTTNGAQTDVNGKFTFNNLLSGNVTLIISYIGYKTVELNVLVTDGKNAAISVQFEASTTALNEVVVEANRITTNESTVLIDRRNSAVVQDAISLEQMERAATINMAQALQKVPGVSLRDGKYVSVRGMTDRNIVVEMNGARMSSSDAARSSVPMDLIPSQLLDNLVVEKTVTADKPGDATAGLVSIKTRSIPDSMVLTFTAQAGYNNNSGFGKGIFSRSGSGKDFLSFNGADFGFFGKGVKHHYIPKAFTDLKSEYEAKGFSANSGAFTNQIQNDIYAGNNSTEAYNQAQKINAAMESFDQNLTVKAKQAPVSQLYNIAFGNRYKLFGKTLGVFVGLNYYRRSESSFGGQNNRYSIREVSPSSPNIVTPNTLRLLRSFSFREDYSIDRLSYGGLATLTYRLDRLNEISVVYNGNYGVEILTDRLYGTINESVVPLIAGTGDFAPRLHSSNTNYVLRATERPFNTVQLRGEHKFHFPFISSQEAMRFSWNASTSYSKQLDPDFRDTYLLADTTALSLNGNSYPVRYSVVSNRYFRDLSEKNQSYKADLVIPVKIFSKEVSFKAGGFYLQRNRKYNEIGSPRTSLAADENGSNLTGLTALRGNLDAWNGSSQIGIAENKNYLRGGPLVSGFLFNPRRSANSYTATQKIGALYGMFDLKYDARLRFIAGLRVENTDNQAVADTNGIGVPMNIDTKAAFDSNYVTNFLTYQWLPSGTAIFSATPQMNFRLAYSNTLARPELNENIHSFQYDPIQQANIIGNNLNLKNALYYNLDFRWEWFPKSQEVISASLFYKKAVDVIERVFTPTTSGFDIYGRQINTISFRNNPSPGYVVGIELEARKTLDMLPGNLKYLFIGANALLAHSETKIPDDELLVRRLLDRNARVKRPLFDQPNYVINANIGYERQDWGSSYSFFFNKTGERLIELSTNGTPNIYDIPAAELDFTFNQRIWKRLNMKGFVKNILNQSTKYQYKENGQPGYGINNETYIRRQFKRGTDILIGFTYTF